MSWPLRILIGLGVAGAIAAGTLVWKDDDKPAAPASAQAGPMTAMSPPAGSSRPALARSRSDRRSPGSSAGWT